MPSKEEISCAKWFTSICTTGFTWHPRHDNSFNTKCPCQCGKKNRGATTCLTTKGSSSHLVFLHSAHHVTCFGTAASTDLLIASPSHSAAALQFVLGCWHTRDDLSRSLWSLHTPVDRWWLPGTGRRCLTTAWTSNWVWFVRLFISACQLLIKLGDGLCVWFYHRKFRLIDSIPVYDAIICHQDWFKDDNGKFLISIHLYMNFNEFHTPTGLSQARLPGSFWLVAADLSPLCICGLWQKLRGETETTSRRQ